MEMQNYTFSNNFAYLAHKWFKKPLLLNLRAVFLRKQAFNEKPKFSFFYAPLIETAVNHH